LGIAVGSPEELAANTLAESLHDRVRSILRTGLVEVLKLLEGEPS
jgi:hypothetical protein